eukprot:scaffold32515_cov31-Tisochrysis_lutea.AAC.1
MRRRRTCRPASALSPRALAMKRDDASRRVWASCRCAPRATAALGLVPSRCAFPPNSYAPTVCAPYVCRSYAAGWACSRR